MTELLETYAPIAGAEEIERIRQLSQHLRGARVVHVNATRVGGGVAEILSKLVPLKKELGLEVHWEVIKGDRDFFHCTKSIHNALHGTHIDISSEMLKHYEETNRRNAEELQPLLREADFVFIHDPQPAMIQRFIPERKGKWIWRCHIDISHPYRPVWKYLRESLLSYDASVFHIADFAHSLPHLQYVIPPSIDPLSEKNIDLPEEEIQSVADRFGLDLERPMIIQVSRFDRLKDPIGVIHAYRLVKTFVPSLQLVLAGGIAADDPEGEAVFEEVTIAAGNDPDIHLLLLPPDAHRTINALQRMAEIVLQKSIREGFGLTVTEAMWKGRPVVGGNTGGIRLQVINHHTGFLVDTPEGAALRVRYLLRHPNIREEMGRKGRRFVRENFLITRQLREYLTLMLILLHGDMERLEIGG